MKKFEKGETLIEAILGLAIAVAIATGIVFAVVNALSQSNSNQSNSYALNFSQEGMSIVKDIAASDYTGFSANTTQYYCLGDGETTLTPRFTNGVSNCPISNIDVGDPSDPEISFLRLIYIGKDGCDHRDTSGATCTAGGTGKQVCINSSAIFVGSYVAWSDSKCSSSSNYCHNTEIDSCVSDLNALPAP